MSLRVHDAARFYACARARAESNGAAHKSHVKRALTAKPLRYEFVIIIQAIRNYNIRSLVHTHLLTLGTGSASALCNRKKTSKKKKKKRNTRVIVMPMRYAGGVRLIDRARTIIRADSHLVYPAATYHRY